MYSAHHKAGYFSNMACDWLSIVWTYSEQGTEHGSWNDLLSDGNFNVPSLKLFIYVYESTNETRSSIFHLYMMWRFHDTSCIYQMDNVAVYDIKMQMRGIENFLNIWCYIDPYWSKKYFRKSAAFRVIVFGNKIHHFQWYIYHVSVDIKSSPLFCVFFSCKFDFLYL